MDPKPIYGFNYNIPYAFPKRSIPKKFSTKKESLGEIKMKS